MTTSPHEPTGILHDTIVPSARAYTLDEPLPAVLRRFTERTGSQPALAVLHRRDLPLLRTQLLELSISVLTASHGGPHPGEIWLQ